MEKDDEVKGQGNHLDFGARCYDSRLGRWLSLDPLAKDYPSLSDYVFVANNPIVFIDPDGRKIVYKNNKATERMKKRIEKLRAKDIYIDAIYSILEKSDIVYTIDSGKEAESKLGGIAKTAFEVDGHPGGYSNRKIYLLDKLNGATISNQSLERAIFEEGFHAVQYDKGLHGDFYRAIEAGDREEALRLSNELLNSNQIEAFHEGAVRLFIAANRPDLLFYEGSEVKLLKKKESIEVMRNSNDNPSILNDPVNISKMSPFHNSFRTYSAINYGKNHLYALEPDKREGYVASEAVYKEINTKLEHAKGVNTSGMGSIHMYEFKNNENKED